MATKLNSKLNALPVNVEWAFKDNAQELQRENHATYEELREVCTFGQQLIGGKVVIRHLSPVYHRSRFAVVSNPIGLDTAHVALFCDRGSLCFGYHMNGSVIEVYND